MISEKYDGKTLYSVEIDKTATDRVWVLAHSEEEAIEDAKEMSYALEFINSDEDYTAYAPETPKVPSGEPIWSGGPDGKEIEFSEL